MSCEVSCAWLKVNPSLKSGIQAINTIDNGKLEQFLNRIFSNLNTPSADIFVPQELTKLEKIFKLDEPTVVLVIKSAQYLLKRMMKFVFKPVHLKGDLLSLTLDDEKADLFIKIWLSETRSAMSDMNDSNVHKNDSLDVKWQLIAEASSDIIKKSKVPKVCVSLIEKDSKSEMQMELTHQELYGMFLQMEAIQTELDSLM